jgi:hypothetical protein
VTWSDHTPSCSVMISFTRDSLKTAISIHLHLNIPAKNPPEN